MVECKSTFDTHAFRIHHSCKIDTPRFEEGKRPSLRRDPAKAFGLAWDANVLTLRKLTKARRTLEGNGEHCTYFLKIPNNQGT